MTAERRRIWVPEVIQSADTDCGPAAVASLLEGFGVRVPYARLRDACGTDVDGTSIDAVEDAAVRFGLDASQTLAPPEHLLSAGSGLLPAIAVLALPGGIAHFVVVWRRIGSWFQVMDPMVGRRWMHRRRLLEVLYRHRIELPADAWREWAGSDANLGPIRDRLGRAGVPRSAVDALVREALADPTWSSLATLDALCRLVEAAREERGAAAGREAARLVARLAPADALAPGWVPERLYGARPGGEPGMLALVGTVLVAAAGWAGSGPRADGPAPTRVLGALASRLPARRALALLLVAGVAGCAAAFEALLFKGVLELGGLVFTPAQRFGAVASAAAFVALALALDNRLATGVRSLGRGLEIGLRVELLRNLARLPDAFFARRLTSDLTLRIHSAVQLRGLPSGAEGAARALGALLCTAAGIAWLDPGVSGLVLVAVAVAVGLPLVLQARLAELELAVATHQGGLSRYLLDALLGAMPLRTHGAQAVLRAEYDQLLARWAGARRSVIRSAIAVDAAIQGIGVLASSAILASHLDRTASAASVLLLGYWAAQLPALGRGLARTVLDVPARRAAGARLLEAIEAPPEARGASSSPQSVDGAAIRFDRVGVHVGAARVLDQIELVIEPGCHCAVVGASGAGKTSLISLLLGWYRATTGRVEVDGRSVETWDPDRLMAQIAWVDPQVALWNRSLYDNLVYGAPADRADLQQVLDLAELRTTVDQLPEGLATVVGQGGSRLSQGEAQRVRLARAMLRKDARLVLLDEGFRGLDRATRTRLAARIRRWWSRATLLSVSHDVHETLGYDRVLVFAEGRIVESGAPAALARERGSAYAALLDAERRVRASFDDGPAWTRWTVRDGRLEVRDRSAAREARR